MSERTTTGKSVSLDGKALKKKGYWHYAQLEASEMTSCIGIEPCSGFPCYPSTNHGFTSTVVHKIAYIPSLDCGKFSLLAM